MAMWGGTWIAGRVIAQELTAPLAVASLRFVLAGLVVAGVMLASEGSIPLPQGRQEWSLVWALTWHEQGDLYRRAGFDVGFVRRF